MPDTHYVYFIKEVRIKKKLCPVKIGVSTNPDKRLASMQTGNACQLELMAKIGPMTRKRAFSTEKTIHEYFAPHRIGGEWFSGKVLNRLKALAAGDVQRFLDMDRIRRKSRKDVDRFRRFMAG